LFLEIGATLAHLSENLITWAKNNLKEDELIGAMLFHEQFPLVVLLKMLELMGGNLVEKFNNKNLKVVQFLAKKYIWKLV
jgi:hypothetical protein